MPPLATQGSTDDVPALLGALRQTPEAFATLFATETEESLHHRPAGGWPAVEIVGHLADHDAFEREERFNAVLRAESPGLPDDNTRLRVAGANHQALSGTAALELFTRERNLTLALLTRLSPNDWQRVGIHPREGARTLFQLADLRGHDREHLDQARAALAGAHG